jgi:hypothetical protein
MNFNHILRASALTLAIAAGAFTAQAKSFVLPHVLEASGSVCSPRDVASGQATGKMVSGYDLKANKGARTAAPSSSGSCDQPPSSSPELDSAAKHNKTGHVTLMK